MLKYHFLPITYYLTQGCVFGLTSANRVYYGQAVWVGKPWVVPVAIARTFTIFTVALLFLFLEVLFNNFLYYLNGLTLWGWTILDFSVIWLLSTLDLLVFWASNNYILRKDGLEIRRGIIRLHSFIVAPAGFGDLLVYQSFGGRIFNYGDITVNSQGERQSKLAIVRTPFAIADSIRDIMGKPVSSVDIRP